MAVPGGRIDELVVQGVLDGAAWNDGLAALARTLGADHLVAVAPGASGSFTPSVAYGFGVPTENIDACSRYPSDIIKLSRLLTPRATAQDETVPLRVFAKMPIFDGAIRPMGGRHAAVARLAAGGFVAACRGGSARPFSDTEKDTLTVLVPALSTAIALKQEFCALQGHAAMLETALDCAAASVIFLDGRRRVFHANAAGEALLRRADILCAAPSGLCAVTPSENERLAAAIASGTGEVVLIGDASAWPLSVRVVGMPARAGATAATIVFVNDPRRPMRNRLAGAGAAFRFTRRETQIAELLAAGMESFEIAATLGITIGNLRGHLTRIFAKTNVGSQAQLVALLLSISS